MTGEIARTETERVETPLLVVEGALDPPGVALVPPDGPARIARLDGRRGGRVDLMDLIYRLLGEAGLEPSRLGGLVLGTGPGSFTGLRVALGGAKGLLFATHGALPAIGIDAPTLLAWVARAELPVRVALPWGRLRVLLARVTDSGPVADRSDLIPIAELGDRRDLVAERVVVAPSARELPFPEGVRRLDVGCSGIDALATLAAELSGRDLDARRHRAEPLYLVAPDAVLPARGAALRDDIDIVSLGPDDLEALEAVERASFEDPWSRSMLEGELRGDPSRIALGVRAGGGLALDAAALARLDDEVLEIISVAVVPGARGRGLGRALVRAFVDRARSHGLTRADLEVSEKNTAAIGLYASEGFVPVGRRPRYYADGSDALLMSLLLRR